MDVDWIDCLMFVVLGVVIDFNDNLVQQSVKLYMMFVCKIGVKGLALSYVLVICLEFYVNLENNYKDNFSLDYILVNFENFGKLVNLEEVCCFLVGEGIVSVVIMFYDVLLVFNLVYVV